MGNVAVPQQAQNAQNAPNAPKPRKKDDPNRHPQEIIDEFWKKFTTQNPGKPFTVLPDNLYAKRAVLNAHQKGAACQNAATSYDRAAGECKAKVEKIAKTCRSRNQKYMDPYFDIGLDLQLRTTKDTLTTLVPDEDDDDAPKSVKRVEDIFEEPHFWGNSMTTDDVCQGSLGNCWFMSALSTLCNNKAFLEKVCVARDEKVGVYGFVFFRDGEWISEVIDDKLYLSKPDWYDTERECNDWLQIKMNHPEKEYRKVMQTGSKALYFAKCKDQNTTWLPLLEKAYAKAHGDYGSLCGGQAGEALEDLTGGIPSDLGPTDILDKNRFWTEELMNVNKTFLFALSQMDGIHAERKGIYKGHSYSIMEARELDNFRLLKIRNPWGSSAWHGPWSNGSEEWTPDRMRRLEHKFSDNGVFWISYEDLLEYFSNIDRTRLFDSDWFLTQKWTSVNVPWSVNYLDTRFQIFLAKAGRVVVVLSQLDDRYFRGLEGQYSFQVQFRLHRSGEDDYLGRTERTNFRAACLELDLEAGEYIVMVKIAATRDLSVKTPQDVVKMNCEDRREKLLAVGLSYDLAHAKGRVKESEKKRQEGLGQGRRNKRKKTAKTNFETQRRWNMKAKLRTARLQAIKDSKNRGQKDQNCKDQENAEEQKNKAEKDKDKIEKGKDEVDIMIKIGENTFRSLNQLVYENGVFEHVVSGKKLKLPSGATDEEGFNGDQQRGDSSETSTNKDRRSSLQAPSSQPQQEDRRSNPATKAPTGSETAEPGQESPDSAPTTTPNLTPESSTGGEQQASGNTELKTSSDADKLAHMLASSELSPPAPPPKPTFEDISDDGLSWSSDIDAPSDTNSDIDSEPEAPHEAATYCETCKTKVSEPMEEKVARLEKNPWNAVCVIGLRVYSKEAQAEVEVNTKEDAADSSKTEMLDMDDQAADATKELGKQSEEEEKKLVDMGKVPEHAEESKQG